MMMFRGCEVLQQIVALRTKVFLQYKDIVIIG
jgi:hypothetical protein